MVQTLSGVVVPVITPLDAEDRVDEPAFRKLLRRLIEIGRDENLDRIIADVLPENRDMQRVFQKLGFRFRRSLGDPTKVEFDL